MAHNESRKCTIAWFKLAEFVGRKEKERALTLYRLLAHSIHDRALLYQLEGDLLASFDDQKAIQAYCKAAALYEAEQRLGQAAALYELLMILNPTSLEYPHKALQMYQAIGSSGKVLHITSHVREILKDA